VKGLAASCAAPVLTVGISVLASTMPVAFSTPSGPACAHAQTACTGAPVPKQHASSDNHTVPDLDCCCVTPLPQGAKREPCPVKRKAAKELVELISAIRACVDDDTQLITTDYELEPYARDAYSYHHSLPPDLVVLPRTTEQVSKIMKVGKAPAF
jgi:hypothetical protein